ncbi:MAG: hypothetical protein ACRC6I_00195 [Paracoccaceae bacterium]
MTRIPAAFLAAVLTTGAAQADDPVQPAFDPSAFASPKTNPWFPLKTGTHFVMIGNATEAADDPDPEEVARIIITGPGPRVMGITTIQVLDEEWVSGVVLERTFDLVAADSAGNIWYFGEDVTNFEYDDAGVLISSNTKGSWRAGEAGALPGILIPGAPKVGDTVFIGQAPDAGEMAFFEVIATDAAVTGPAGSFTGVLKLRHGSTLDPEDREFKYYAPGLGMILEEDDLSAAFDTPEFIGERQP